MFIIKQRKNDDAGRMIEGRSHLSGHHPHAGFNMIDGNGLALIECTETLWAASS